MTIWKKTISSIFVVMMLIALLPLTAFATVTAQVTGDGAITITTSAAGQLESAVNASGVLNENVKSITMTDGLLNSKDTNFINTKLLNLETLNLVGTADFQDSTMPSKAFEGNKSLQNVKLLNTKILSSRVFYQAIAAENGSLTTVELPSVTSIADRAFYRSPIKSLSLGEIPPTMVGSKGGDEGYWFKEATGDVTIYVPTPEAIDKYENVFAFEGFRIRVIGDTSDDGSGDGTIDTYGYTGYGNDKVLPRKYAYYTGDYKLSLNFYSFNANLNAWKSDSTTGVPQLNPLDAIQWAKDAGFDAVDVTEYYIKGYSDAIVPEADKPGIMQYAREIKAKAKEAGIEISGTGAQNNFVQPSAEKRAIDMERYKFWIDVAAEMGAPVIRVFAGPTPSDTKQLGWETIAKERLVPHLKELADYASSKGVKLGLQNHGDFTSTADQIIQIIKWVDSPNIGIIDDTGYFRPFRGSSSNYNWYADINAALPYSVNFQVKKKPAGAETQELMDMDRLFSGIRSSDYHGFIPAELLWNPGDSGHPSTLTTPPFEEVSGFLVKMKAAMQNTKTSGKMGTVTLSGTAGKGSAQLSWSPSPNATKGYFVKKKNADNTYSLLGTVDASTYSYQDISARSGTPTTYVVTGFDSEREFAESNEVTVNPQEAELSAQLTGTVNVMSGQSFDLTYGLSGVKESIYAQDITVTYDPAKVEFVSVKSAKEGFSVVDTKSTSGQIRIIAASLGNENAIKANSDLLKLNWKALVADSTTVNVTVSDVIVSNAEGVETKVGSATHEVQIIVPADKTALNAFINEVQSKHDAAVEGTKAGQYQVGSKAALQAAIDLAKAVSNNEAASKQQVEQAITDMSHALKVFQDSYVRIGEDIKVTIGDLAIVAKNYGKTSDDPDWDLFKIADVNNDGKIDLMDLVIVARKILQD